MNQFVTEWNTWRDSRNSALAKPFGWLSDVVRRWPSVEKAKRLLGWEAQIGLREGIGQTVAWLRDTLPQPTR